MESEAKSVEELIAAILDDISQKGFSSVMPFSIGSVEVRMCQFADANGVELASYELYFITATRRTDKKEFNGKRYVKIENGPVTE